MEKRTRTSGHAHGTPGEPERRRREGLAQLVGMEDSEEEEEEKTAEPSLWRALKEPVEEHKNGAETDLFVRTMISQKRKERRTRTSPHGHKKAKEGHRRAEERKPARRDSAAEKAQPQPKWWRKRRLDKTKWGKDDMMDAGEVERTRREEWLW